MNYLNLLLLRNPYYDEYDYESDLEYQADVDKLFQTPFGEVITDIVCIVILVISMFAVYSYFKSRIRNSKIYKWGYAIFVIFVIIILFKYYGIYLSIFFRNIFLIGLSIFLLYHYKARIKEYIKGIFKQDDTLEDNNK